MPIFTRIWCHSFWLWTKYWSLLLIFSVNFYHLNLSHLEGRHVIYCRTGLFCSLPPSLLIVSNQGGVQFLYNTPSLRYFAHEARQRWKLRKKARGIVVEAWNEKDFIMNDLTVLPELSLPSIVNSNVPWVGHNLLYILHYKLFRLHLLIKFVS